MGMLKYEYSHVQQQKSSARKTHPKRCIKVYILRKAGLGRDVTGVPRGIARVLAELTEYSGKCRSAVWQLAVATPTNLVLVYFSFLKTHSCVRTDQEDEVQMGRTIRSFEDDCFGLKTMLAIIV